MQHFERNNVPPPGCLSDDRGKSCREMLRSIFTTDAISMSQTSISMASVIVVDTQLDLALKRLFQGRCAFCDAVEKRTHDYRFRPIEEAGPSDLAPSADADRSHLYYTWLVNDWNNIYAVCSGCTPTEPSIFPVIGRRCHLPSREDIERYADQPVGTWGKVDERPWFLDPCANEDFRRHLAALPNGELIGLSGRGVGTIRHFNLDRPALISRRSLALYGYKEELLRNTREGTTSLDLFDFEEMEFGGCWFLLLYQLARKLGGGAGARPTLSRKKIGHYYSQRFRGRDSADRIEAAFQDLYEHPEQINSKQVNNTAPTRGDARPVSFTIENFKALESVEINLNAREASPSSRPAASATSAAALVIIGENAAGKSSILEAMTLALCGQEVRDDLSLDATRFMLDPVMMGLAPGNVRREGSVRVRYEDASLATMRVSSEFPFTEGADIARIPVFAYGAFRLFLRAEKRQRKASPIRSLFEANYVLPNPEKWLASLEPHVFSEVVRRLKMVLAIDQDDIEVIEVGPEPDECSLLVTVSRPDQPPLRIRTPFSAVSSGFRSILAMICDVMRGLIEHQDFLSASLANARAVVLIDEVEAHLHPRWKMRIINGLREALPNVTFIMTTHDPLCLRGVAAQDVRVFRRVQRLDPTEGAELPTYVEQLEELPAFGTLTIEQLLTSDLFQLHSTDAPELERNLAKAGDLLARERDAVDPASPMKDEDTKALSEARLFLRTQIGRAIPIGNTEVERLIQEAVETYIRERRGKRPRQIEDLRSDTRAKIVAALEGL